MVVRRNLFNHKAQRPKLATQPKGAPKLDAQPQLHSHLSPQLAHQTPKNMSFLSLRQISKTNQAQLHLQRCREVPRRLQTFQLGHHFHLAKTRIPFSSRSFIISDPSSANFLCFSSNSFKFSKHSAFSRLCCWCAGTGTPTHRQNLGSFRKHHRKPRVVAPPVTCTFSCCQQEILPLGGSETTSPTLHESGIFPSWLQRS